MWPPLPESREQFACPFLSTGSAALCGDPLCQVAVLCPLSPLDSTPAPTHCVWTEEPVAYQKPPKKGSFLRGKRSHLGQSHIGKVPITCWEQSKKLSQTMALQLQGLQRNCSQLNGQWAEPRLIYILPLLANGNRTVLSTLQDKWKKAKGKK